MFSISLSIAALNSVKFESLSKASSANLYAGLTLNSSHEYITIFLLDWNFSRISLTIQNHSSVNHNLLQTHLISTKIISAVIKLESSMPIKSVIFLVLYPIFLRFSIIGKAPSSINKISVLDASLLILVVNFKAVFHRKYFLLIKKPTIPTRIVRINIIIPAHSQLKSEALLITSHTKVHVMIFN